MISLFQELRILYGSVFQIGQICRRKSKKYWGLNINKLDMKRIYRYLDKKCQKKTVFQRTRLFAQKW